MPSKYKNIKTIIDNIPFDSKKEAARYLQLKMLFDTGVITELELQPAFKLVINGQKICTYKADFRYCENGKSIVEDVKGMKTPIYNLKKKLMFACHGIKILET